VRLDAINDRPMKVVGVSRRALFEQIDRPALKPLPQTRYELAEWKPCRVNIDYHVEVDHYVYSVPYQLVPARVEARVTQTTVEVFYKGGRVASHARLTGRGRFSTQLAHIPRAHRAHAEWTPSRWSRRFLTSRGAWTKIPPVLAPQSLRPRSERKDLS
jgi:hypothetical protein